MTSVQTFRSKSDGDAAPAPPSPAHIRVLLVDDNPDDRALVARELAHVMPDVEVEQVADEPHLAARLEDGAFDIVITDYQLHWTDGLFILRAIKMRWPDKPVIMCTGTGSEEIAVAAMHSGLEDYVIKAPNHFKRLPVAVINALSLAKQRAAAQEAETRYRDLFSGVPVGLFRTTGEGQIVDVNPAFSEILSSPDRNSLLRARAQDLYVNPQDRVRLQERVAREGQIIETELQLRRFDGTTVWVRASARAMRDPSGRITGYEGSIIDITEERHAQRQTLDGERAATVSQIAGFLAHDLNTPLTNISLLATSISRTTKDPEIQAKVEKIHVQRRIASELISDMMSISKLQPVAAVETDLRKIVEAAVESVEVYRKPEVRVQQVLGAEPVPARVDAVQMREAVATLVKNAFQATSAGTVSVVLRRSSDKVSIVITDTGSGIPPEVRSRLFEPFFTTKPRGEGTGLGLALCRNVVDAHGGTIEMASQVGKGSSFAIVLPSIPPAVRLAGWHA